MIKLMRRQAKLHSSFGLLLTVGLLLPGLSMASSKTAMEWIQTMSDAMRNLNYRGNFVYLHDHQLESMSISHTRDADGEKERLLSLNGEAREVIRDDQNLTCIWPSSRKVVVDSSRKNSFSPLFIPDDVDRISKLYDISLIGKDRIANKQTVVVQIMPKDQYRYGLRFWIDSENGLLMKSNLIAENNQVVEQVMFTNIELLKEGEQLVINDLPEIDDNYTLLQYHRGQNTQQVEGNSEWQMNFMPTGFWQESVLERHDSESGQFFHQMVYTDGLASLSVFIEKQPSQLHRGESSMGAVNAFIRMTNNFSVTAIGEVPAVTVKTMAESVVYLKH